MTVESDFLVAMAAAGLAPAKDIPVADGTLRRYRVEGDKPGSRNGWYVLHAGPIPAGAFGSWKTGVTHTWRAADDRPTTRAERAEHRRQVELMRQQRAVAEAETREAARRKAERLWRLARPADAAHPYLARKGVKAWGLRQLRDMLLIPARDAAGVLHTIQFIGPDGDKRFLTGGRIAECYFAIGRPAETLLLAEGLATAATVYEATGQATACCFNAGNLMPVARVLRRKFPRLRFIIAADADPVGQAKAWEAAGAVGGAVATPRFSPGVH